MTGLGALEVARSLPIDAAYVREIVEELSAIGSSPLGFRVAGTPEDAATAAAVAARMRTIGLAGVGIEKVSVGGWRFEEGYVELADGTRFPGASFGGAPGTPADGLAASLRDVGRAERRRLDGRELTGAIALVDWASANVSLEDVALELGLRGAIGLVVACPEGGPYYQSADVFGSFNSSWYGDAPPLLTISKESQAALRRVLAESPELPIRFVVRATTDPSAQGSNSIGWLPGETSDAPMVVGAHHDAWFHGAFDDATGVAAMLAVARGLAEIGLTPRHSIAFSSRTGEEYGTLDTPYDWCAGAWRQVVETHPEWRESVAFHLCAEANGHPRVRATVEAPPELFAWSRVRARTADREGWLPSGWRMNPPATGTEHWPFLVEGIPGVAAYTFDKGFARTDYHTANDTVALVDFDHCVGMARFYAYLLLSADAEAETMLDHGARSRAVEKATAGLDGTSSLYGATARHATAVGRAAFTSVGREALGVTAGGATAQRHTQARTDVEQLEQALAALARDDRRATLRALGRVGDNAHARTLSEETFRRRLARRQPETAASWGRSSHPTPSPNLWSELASLRRERGARPVGPWLEESLQNHLEEMRAELGRRLAAMEAAFGAAADGGEGP